MVLSLPQLQLEGDTSSSTPKGQVSHVGLGWGLGGGGIGRGLWGEGSPRLSQHVYTLLDNRLKPEMPDAYRTLP